MAIDLIRIIACIAVVGLHSTKPQNENILIASTLYYMCGFAVPFFFMSSGYFLMNRDKKFDGSYTVQKSFRILRLVLLWNIIFCLMKLAIAKQLIYKETVIVGALTIAKESIKGLIQRGQMWQFWYLGALLILYWLLPFITRLNSRGQRWVLYLAGSISVVIEILSYCIGKPIQKNVIQTFRLWTWLFYFMLGGFICRKALLLNRMKSINTKMQGIVISFYTLLLLLYQNYAGRKLMSETGTGLLHAEYFYDDIFEMLWIILLFTFLLRLNYDRIKGLISKIAPLTLGIYIIHPKVLSIVGMVFGKSTVSEIIIGWLTTLFLSSIVVGMIRKLPFGKYLIRL